MLKNILTLVKTLSKILFNIPDRCEDNFNRGKKWNEVKVAQLFLTLCNLMEYIFNGILQARILEWVASLLQGLSGCQAKGRWLARWKIIEETSSIGGFLIKWTQQNSCWRHAKVIQYQGYGILSKLICRIWQARDNVK